MEKIIINLSIDETNIILNALGDQPYKDVYQLIQSIQNQAAQQVHQENTPGKSRHKENGTVTKN